jgi:hypothetical protein
MAVKVQNNKVETPVEIAAHVLTGYVPQSQETSEFPTKSARIRYLASKGMKTGDIAKLMGIRYQHVRNTLQRPLKSATSV